MSHINEIKKWLEDITKDSPFPWSYTNQDEKNNILINDTNGNQVCTTKFPSQANFIANCPENVSYLLSEVERLKGYTETCVPCLMNNHGMCRDIKCVFHRYFTKTQED